MKRVVWFLAWVLISSSAAVAQDDPGVYQISGIVISKSSQEPIPFVTIRVNHTRRGAVANAEGFYSIPVGILDTLYFSHLGYHASKLVVLDYLREYQGDKSQFLYVVNYLWEDTLTLPTVLIFPYDTPEELRTAFVNMDNALSPLDQNAINNMDPRTLHTIMASLPVDAGERVMVGRQMYYDYYRTQNLLPTVGFDPLTAFALLKYVVDQTKKRRDKNLNYWSD